MTTGYHVSREKLGALVPRKGMWLTDRIEIARAYRDNVLNDSEPAFVYRVSVAGEILSSAAFEIACERLGIDAVDFIADLTANPKNASLDPRSVAVEDATGASGFYHADYDPRDYTKDVESIFLFDPKASVRSIEEIEL